MATSHSLNSHQVSNTITSNGRTHICFSRTTSRSLHRHCFLKSRHDLKLKSSFTAESSPVIFRGDSTKQQNRRVRSMADSDTSGKDSRDGLGIPQWKNLPSSNGESAEEGLNLPDEVIPAWKITKKDRTVESNARIVNPFKEMVSTASRKLQDYLDRKKGMMEEELAEDSAERDWKKWQLLIKRVDEKYSILETLQAQMDEAAEKEEFKEAGKLKSAFDACAKGDPMATSLAELERAVKAEDYSRAAQIRDETCTDLIGWWSGQGEETDDPFGRIVNITALQGRLVARTYTAKHLASAREGSQLFEIFVDHNDQDGSYSNQPVFLRRKSSVGLVQPYKNSLPLDADKFVRRPKSEPNSPTEDSSNLPETSAEKNDPNTSNTANPEPLQRSDSISRSVDIVNKLYDLMDNGLDSVIGSGPPGSSSRGPGLTGSSDWKKMESSGAGNSVDFDLGKGVRATVSLKVDEVSGSQTGFRVQGPIRMPAKIERRGRDEFCFVVDGLEGDSEGLGLLNEAGLDGRLELKNIAAERAANTESGSYTVDQLPGKRQNLDRLMRLALVQAKKSALTKKTRFRRIPSQANTTDTLSGLYVGAFGPYTSEVVQLTRKIGKWEGDLSDSPPYEYVEAIKLTGDLNVPAGQVTFRAKVGRLQRLSGMRLYPEELGMTARYGGQGRLAEQGFKNARWVEGELVLLDARAKQLLNGAELGFIYSVPERNFLVLFNRLNLK